MLLVNNLSVNYKLPVLDGVSISISPGELVCLIGKSGSGKTTLLNSICQGHPNIQRISSIALITQESLLLNWRTAFENVILPLELKGTISTSTIDKARRLLTTVGLENSLNKLPKELSGGMKQRVALARGLLEEAELYLFDEPLSAIDFDLRILLGKTIRDFIISNKRGALFVTHNLEEAIALGDRVLVLGGSPGKIVFEQAISLSESNRDPVSLRAQPEFANLFGSLWGALGL